MGMFIIIDTKKKCPYCKAKVEWQSKFVIDLAGQEVNRGLQRVKLKEIEYGEMYTLCYKCEGWAEGSIKDGKFKLKNHKEMK